MKGLPRGCEPACPGCSHRRRTAQESAAQKLGFLDRQLAPWADARGPLAEPAPDRRFGYRDRSVLSARWQGNAWQFGLMRRDELIAIPECPVHTRAIHAAVALLGPKLPPPPEFPLAFLIPNGSQLSLVVKAKQAPREWFTPELGAALMEAGYEGLWLHLHPSAGIHPLAGQWELLAGAERSRDGTGLWYGPAAFRQLIPELYAASLDEARQFLAPGPGDRVADLYCGIGASAQAWLAAGAAVIGVEVGGEAIECAARNATGALLLRGSCEHRLPQLRAWTGAGRRLLYLNPPRTGLEAPVADWAATEWRAERIAYLSCSPGTLSRDLERLCRAGYRVARLSPYDFFPGTHHVETLALLELERAAP